MKSKIFSVLLYFFLSTIAVNAQNIATWIEDNDKLPTEKIYLHVDREFYFTGETVWFRAYLTDSRSGRLIPGAENIYLQLMDESGKVAAEMTVLSINGMASSQLELPVTLKPGNYLFQAYTDYLMNFSVDAFFSKLLYIAQPALSFQTIENQKQRQPQLMVADVSFLPEGGIILEGISNLVAFKAIDKNGYGIEASGLVKDDSGNEVVTFRTDYKGMGIFFLNPVPGKFYHAEVNGFPTFKYRFDPHIFNEGVKIQLVNQTCREFLINITGNSEKFTGEPFFLVNRYRGQTIFYQSFIWEGENHLLKFETNILKGGINQLILLDKNLNPISERLLFSDNYDVKNLTLGVSDNALLPRSEIRLILSGNEMIDETAYLSMAVVHEAAFPNEGPSQNILSELLISSEMKGFIETPASYFSSNEMDAKAKLQLLMLTNGWSSYFWNQVPNTTQPIEFKQNAGLELHGKAIETATENPLKNGEITLILEKDGEMAFLTQNTDSEGFFKFSGLLFNDTANVYIQAKNEKRKQNTTITLLPLAETAVHAQKINALGAEKTIPEKLDKLKYNHQLAFYNYTRTTGGLKQNEERSGAEISPPKDSHFKIYDKADQVIEIPESEASFGNILDFLTGKVAGLDINDGTVNIRGTSNLDGNSTPLFLIDGVPLNSGNFSTLPAEVGQNTGEVTKTGESTTVEKIKAIPLGDIDKVEILKSPQNLAIFGTEGSNGVIAIYTRKGKSVKSSSIVKGVIEQKIGGYTAFKKFYSPKHTPDNNSMKKPDSRITLFWEPEIMLEKVPVELSFFTSDQPGKYHIFVEGISESGRICIGKTEFEVLEKTSN